MSDRIPPPLPLPKNKGKDHEEGNMHGLWLWKARDQRWHFRGTKRIGRDHKRAYPHEFRLLRMAI